MWGSAYDAGMKPMNENLFVLSVMSDDHPGIVAAVGQAVCGAGGNIDAISQTVLEGYFTLTMIVSFPEALSGETLAATVQAAGSHFEVTVHPFVGEVAGEKIESERFVVTAFGPDRPGIVLRFSQYLAGKDINIIDLYGDRKDDGSEEFVLIGQVEIPCSWNISHLQADLEEIGKELGFAVRLQHENIFVATNQLRLRHGTL